MEEVLPWTEALFRSGKCCGRSSDVKGYELDSVPSQHTVLVSGVTLWEKVVTVNIDVLAVHDALGLHMPPAFRSGISRGIHQALMDTPSNAPSKLQSTLPFANIQHHLSLSTYCSTLDCD